MSYAADDVYDVYSETKRRARKAHRCAACREPILAGHVYTRVFMIFDGTKHSLKRCARCQALHLHLRERCEARRRASKWSWLTDDNLWPDEWLNCGESYEDEWGDCPPEIQALAFALPGEVDKPT